MFSWFKKKEKKEVHTSDPVKYKASGSVYSSKAGVDISGRNEVTFIPTRDFAWVKEDGTLMAEYVKGMTYRKRAGNLVLQELLPQWEKDGKVIIEKKRK